MGMKTPPKKKKVGKVRAPAAAADRNQIKTATPNATPRMEMSVMTDTNVRLGRK